MPPGWMFGFDSEEYRAWMSHQPLPVQRRQPKPWTPQPIGKQRRERKVKP